jgi:putative transposase
VLASRDVQSLRRLFDHLKLLYSAAYLKQRKSGLEVMTETGMADLDERTMNGYLARLCSLQHFMKELKERFSRCFNKRHGRRGTLWQDRYRSILVEDGEALPTAGCF